MKDLKNTLINLADQAEDLYFELMELERDDDFCEFTFGSLRGIRDKMDIVIDKLLRICGSYKRLRTIIKEELRLHYTIDKYIEEIEGYDNEYEWEFEENEV